MKLPAAILAVVATLAFPACKDETPPPAKSGDTAKDIAKGNAKMSDKSDSAPKPVDPLKDGY